MAAGAVSGLIFDELLTGRAERLPELLPDLLFAMLVPYIGPSAAAEEMRKAAAGLGRSPRPPAGLPPVSPLDEVDFAAQFVAHPVQPDLDRAFR